MQGIDIDVGSSRRAGSRPSRPGAAGGPAGGGLAARDLGIAARDELRRVVAIVMLAAHHDPARRHQRGRAEAVGRFVQERAAGMGQGAEDRRAEAGSHIAAEREVV